MTTVFNYDNQAPYDAPVPYDGLSVFSPPGLYPFLPHLQVPFILQGDGTWAVWQQDTIDEVGQSVEVVCGTLPGERTVVPTYGLPDQTFTGPQPNVGVITRTIAAWEPRAQVTVKVSSPSNNGQAQVSVAVALSKTLPAASQ